MRTSKSQRWLLIIAGIALLSASLWVAGDKALPAIQAVLTGLLSQQ